MVIYMKAIEAVKAALIMAAHLNISGAIDESRQSRYYGTAAAYLNVLQYEISSYCNLPPPVPISDLEQDLGLDNEVAARLLPAGLVMYFALIDRDTALYNHYAELYYERLLPQIKLDEILLEDYYCMRSDNSFQ